MMKSDVYVCWSKIQFWCPKELVTPVPHFTSMVSYCCCFSFCHRCCHCCCQLCSPLSWPLLVKRVHSTVASQSTCWLNGNRLKQNTLNKREKKAHRLSKLFRVSSFSLKIMEIYTVVTINKCLKCVVRGRDREREKEKNIFTPCDMRKRRTKTKSFAHELSFLWKIDGPKQK